MLSKVVTEQDLISVRQAIGKLSSLKLGPTSTPTFANVSLSGLTASRLLSTDADSKLASVSNLASWVAGTTNQLTVTDDTDGSITLSLPQNIHTGATPTFAGLTVVNAITEFSTDDTLGGNSDSTLPTEKAVKTYVDSTVGMAIWSWDGGSSDVTVDTLILDAETLT